jgi:hypothetical protein
MLWKNNALLREYEMITGGRMTIQGRRHRCPCSKEIELTALEVEDQQENLEATQKLKFMRE